MDNSSNSYPGTSLDEVLEAAELIPALWAEKYEIKTSAGLPFDLEGEHRFMRQPFNDMSPLQAWLKPPQIGATETNLVKSFYVAKKLRKDIIYTLPTASDVNDMAGGKINRIVAQNAIIRKWVKDHDTVEQKAVGENIIYYRGTFSSKQAMMVSSQLNIHDEVDASDASVVTQYETRQQAIADGWRWYFSHPSLAGHGVDVYWQQSDKKEWFVTCQICNHIQVMTWPENINIERQCYVCSKCNGTLTKKAIIDGDWMPTATGPFSGYHFSQLMCPWITAKAIIEAKNDPMKDEQYFFNYVLGLPYIASENKISSDIVLKNVVPTLNAQNGRIVIGVDTGLPIYYTVLNPDGVFFFGHCQPAGMQCICCPNRTHDPYTDLDKMLQRWPDAILVSDQGGDLSGIRILQGKYPTRVFLCYYRKDRKSKELIRWGEHKEFGMVMVDRNRMIQLIVEQMRDVGRIQINGSTEEWRPWAKHFDNIFRVIKETPFGAEYIWERKGPDHYVHSLLYALVGLDRFAEDAATILGPGAFSDLPTGILDDGFNGGSIFSVTYDND